AWLGDAAVVAHRHPTIRHHRQGPDLLRRRPRYRRRRSHPVRVEAGVRWKLTIDGGPARSLARRSRLTRGLRPAGGPWTSRARTLFVDGAKQCTNVILPRFPVIRTSPDRKEV